MNIERIQSAVVSPSPRPASQEAPVKTAQVATQNYPVAASNGVTPPRSSSIQDDKATLEHAVARLSDYVSTTQAQINFSIDETSGIRVVKIIDGQSKDVIRQIPSEEAIQLAQVLDKLQGLFVKDQA